MSTFYLLPPRPQLGERFAGFLKQIFPGLEWDSTRWSELAELVGSATAHHPDVYIVFGEELPAGNDVADCLAEAFGAEPGDELIEVRPGALPGQMPTRRWRIE
jgi:hypothetical protein